ncbi:MAG: hypothetical protein ACJAX6_000772 [Limisphaerales bacterium]|jgi:hypothetical protein
MGAFRLWGDSKRAPDAVVYHIDYTELPVTGRGRNRGYFLTPPLQAKFSKKQKQQ